VLRVLEPIESVKGWPRYGSKPKKADGPNFADPPQPDVAPRPRKQPLTQRSALTLARDDNEAEIAREYEIRVLERDAKIDADTALCLRKNLLGHFFASDAAPREPLAELPHPIEFDEAAVLKAARLQCPHFDSLSLEGQLKYLEEDLLKKRQRAATSRQHAEAVALRAAGSKEALNARIEASMWELGPGLVPNGATSTK
jgi:hypothetical protein